MADELKDKVTPEDVQKMFDMNSKDAFGALLMLLAIRVMLPGQTQNNEAEYWRGAYEAMKDLSKES